MPRPRRQVVKATAMRDIVAAVPFQCGFHPRHSLVVVSLRGPRRRVGQVTRVDLPPPGEGAAVAADLAHFVARDEGVASMVLAYDDQPWDPARPPHRDAVRALTDALEEQGVPALDAVYVGPDRYWSYDCLNPRCCPPDGSPLADALSSPIAAAYVLAGLAPLASRDELAARVRPTRPLLLAAVEDSTWRWLAAYAAEADAAELSAGASAGADRAVAERTAAAVRVVEDLLPGYRTRTATVSVEQAGQLLAVLQDVTLRDALMIRFCRTGLPLGAVPPPGAPGPEDDGDDQDRDDQAGEDSDRAGEDAVERLLVDLCVRVDGPLACAPLTLLAWHSWARGEGALARIAVDRALAQDPTYRLARLLAAALDGGLPPDWVRQMRREDERAS